VKKLFLLLLLLAGGAKAEEPLDFSYRARLIGEDHEARSGSPFAKGLPFTTFGRDRTRAEGELRGRAGPISLLATETATRFQGSDTTSAMTVNEAYASFGSGELRGTAGRKILSGDVGYGFRPIDVIQREPRLQVLPPALVGVDHVSIEHFTAERAVSVILANPGNSHAGDPKDDGSLALRYYQRLGKADLHGVARFSDRFGVEAGPALSAVPNESLELHGSFLWMKRAERTAPSDGGNFPDPGSALTTETVDHVWKALAGFTWTHEKGFSFLGEAWWDGTAPGAADWQRLAAQAAQLNAFALAASTRIFQQPNLARRTALARMAWTDPSGSGWTASVDMLRSLDDRSYSATAAIAWEADRLRIDAGVRRYGGRPDSAYGLLPERGLLFAGASLAF
jgi:hypothetical protein